MENCIFCKIVNKQIASENVAETGQLLAFKDIHPKAPVHILIIPKRHVDNPSLLNADELVEMLKLVGELAEKFNVNETGYRLLFNVGKHAGQEIDHVHLHLVGGKQSQSLY